MTSTRDAHTIEARKARYSRELAAYTLRQWDLVRQSAESDGEHRDSSASPSGRSRSQPRDNNTPSRASQGIHAHDYAHGLHRQTSGRAVAGNA
ncbi:uncharacterized protein TRAVEDRAFT_68613 [Trametes versicolor FP-101664 SS1]|uniref:uncharacterized protein n=1 Tax=Trametes versicolor (strain FP-101664) TaxID=717944 RepID=UPI0004623018|nr:uncharacterized protein TRAVEDRAFT_68613 [Trametes versicolor FP-101664 SS1]EIW64917.1 hypothetical protein TRAVEDRAFT_68613 [Trametes versicolor FP-101664 SS1]